MAQRVFEGDENLVEVPQIESSEGFEIMRDFVEDLRDERARDALADALDRPKPFRRFKDALVEFPAVREQWFAFERARKEEIARRWLEELGIQPVQP